jgi:hypothetical protein
MRYFLMVLALGGTLFAQAGAPASPPPGNPRPGSADEGPRKAKALVDQMIQALGGQAYMTIAETMQQGRTYSFHHGLPTSVGVQFWRFYKFPDNERIEFTKKRDVSYVYTGDQGYEITYKGTRAQDPKDVTDYLRRREHSLDWVLRKWLVQPGVLLLYNGQTVAAQKPAEQVSIITDQDQSVILYIDLDTHLPVKKSYSWRDPVDKQRDTEDEIFDNYRPVQGIMTPFSITRFYNGDMSNQRFLNEVKYNQGVQDSMFAVSVPNVPAKH